MHAYLKLERLRHGRQVRIDYHADQPMPNLAISPLLFPFVENAFKHGIDSSLDESWVSIAMRVEGTQLHFAVRNSYSRRPRLA